MNEDVLGRNTKPKLCLLFLDRRPAHSLSSVSTQYSSEDDSHAEMMKDDVKGNEEYNIQRASDNTAHAQYGNENRENKLLRMKENQEAFALEKEGIDEAEKAKPEDLTAREDTGVFHENTMAIQYQSPAVNGDLKQSGSVESNIGEDGEKNASTRSDDGDESFLVSLESSMTKVEDSNEESPQGDEGGGEYNPSAQLRVLLRVLLQVLLYLPLYYVKVQHGECSWWTVFKLLV